MRTVTLDQASVDLKNIILRAIRDQDETVIVSNEGMSIRTHSKNEEAAYGGS